MTIEDIARICHEANKALCESVGDFSQKPWKEAEGWQRDSAITGVRFALDNPDAPASAQHDSWTQEKLSAGWKYGPVKDADKKEHPCLVPFEQLPPEQQAKDYLFKAIVRGLAQFVIQSKSST
jgi:hypothetical protein